MTINITLPQISHELTIDNLYINREKIEEIPGIYYLYDRNRKLLYVGQAKNLYNRLLQHRSGHSNSRTFYEEIAFIDVSIVYDDYYREVYETYAIHELMPSCNRSKSFKRVKSDAEYEAQEIVAELRDERRSLVSETRKLRESFGTLEYFVESEMDADDLADWGTILHNENRIDDIDAEITELKRIR